MSLRDFKKDEQNEYYAGGLDENGGGYDISWTPTPGADLARLSPGVLVGCRLEGGGGNG